MSVSRINDDSINTCLNQSFCTIHCICSNTDAGSHTQTTFFILAGHWFVFGFGNILIGNQAHKTVVLVYNGQFFYLVFLKNLCRSNQISLLMRSHKVLFCHHFINLFIHTTLKTQVAIGHDTYEFIIVIDYRNTTNVVIMHQLKSILNRTSTTNCHRIINHSVLSTLYNCHLMCLFFYRHILVDNAYSTFTGDGDSH